MKFMKLAQNSAAACMAVGVDSLRAVPCRMRIECFASVYGRWKPEDIGAAFFGLLLILMLSLTPVTALAQVPDGAVEPGDPRALPPKNTLKQLSTFRVRGGVVTAGVGMRGGRGDGTIIISDVPTGSTISRAYLYWATVGNGASPSYLPAPPNANTGLLNGRQVYGDLVGSDTTPCWLQTSSIHTFRADVTTLVDGNNSYRLSGFSDSGMPNISPSMEGAALVVVYTNPRSPLRTVLLYEGAETVISSTNTTNFIGFEASSPVTSAVLTVVVADGQNFGDADDRLIVNGSSIAIGRFDGNSGPMWDVERFDITNRIPSGSTSLSVTLASTVDPVTRRSDCLTWVTGIVELSAPPGTPTVFARPLGLFFSNDPDPNRPLAINYKYIERTEGLIVADVTVSNLHGTWFEVGIDFLAPSAEAPTPIDIGDGQRAFAFMIGPFASKTIRATFRPGQYLHWNANRVSLAAFTMLAIDLIGRGLLGVELTEFGTKGVIEFGVGIIDELFATIKSNCSGDAGAASFRLTQGDRLGALESLVAFISCTARNDDVARAIARFISMAYDNAKSREWIAIAGNTTANFLQLLDALPRLGVLTQATVMADTDGFVRLEAR